MLKLEDKTMDYNKAALEMHETHKGKVGIVSKVEVATRDDLSTAYTPGVARDRASLLSTLARATTSTLPFHSPWSLNDSFL